MKPSAPEPLSGVRVLLQARRHLVRTPGLKALGLFLALPLLVLAIACGDDDDTTPSDVSTSVSDVAGAQSDVCDSVDQLQDAVNEASDLNTDSTVDQADEAASNIQDALDSLQGSAGDVGQALLNTLQTAVQALQDGIQNISGDETLGGTATQISSLVSAIGSALSPVESEAGCS
jgi:ElaB/YqjD/DUF883 family membrane-anchored ribosome-binding protein